MTNIDKADKDYCGITIKLIEIGLVITITHVQYLYMKNFYNRYPSDFRSQSVLECNGHSLFPLVITDH